jgi:hypothetical protein
MTIKNVAESAADSQVDVPPPIASTFEIKSVDPATVPLASIKRDEALSCRARGIDARTVAEYAEAMRAGASFPPIVVFRDAKAGHCWLADGFHRTAAAELAGLAEIAADVREGGRRDALLHAASANSAHGLRRTNADKRHAVVLVLKSFPKWSDRKIGDACGVDHKTVGAARKVSGEIPQPTAFDGERETAYVERMMEALVERWPVDQRARFHELLVTWLARADAPAIRTSTRTTEAEAATTEGRG